MTVHINVINGSPVCPACHDDRMFLRLAGDAIGEQITITNDTNAQGDIAPNQERVRIDWKLTADHLMDPVSIECANCSFRAPYRSLTFTIYQDRAQFDRCAPGS